MNENLAQLKKLAQIFNTDKLISPEEIQQIFTGIVEILATYKKGTENINQDTKSVVNKLLEDVISIHKESLSAVEEKKKELGNDFADKLTELRQMVTSIQEEMDKEEEEEEDDTDDEEEKQALIDEIMAQITLPEVKATIVSGEEIVDKINELPLDDDNKIDWARIKNAPKIGKQTISGSPTVLANAVDLDGSTRADGYKISWDAVRGRYTHTADAGGNPGGSTTQLQYNNAGAFGGISGATTNGTAVTYTAGNLIAADITASGSGGLLLQSNNGTDALLIGAGGGAGATFYGGVNIAGDVAVDTNVLYVDTTNNRVGIGTTSPVNNLHVVGQGGTGGMVVGDASIGAGYTGLSLRGTLSSTNYNLAGGSDSNLYVNRPTGGNILFRENNGTARVVFNASGLNGFETTAPTHTLTLGSTSTGIALYNTADQTTNYERGRLYWSSNILTLTTENGGSGTIRGINITSGSDMRIVANDQLFLQNDVTDRSVEMHVGGTRGTTHLNQSTQNQSSGTTTLVTIRPTISQTSTAGYTALLVNPTETTTGSGTKLLADFQVGGSSKANIDNTGLITSPQVINTPATITVTSNAGTVTRANRVNNFTNSSAATMTITMSTTSAADGDMVMVRIKDFSAAAQTITWVNTENSTVTAPTTSNGSTTLPLTVGFIYNSATSKWRCIASA